MANKLSDLSGTVFVTASFPLAASGANTALEAIIPNPFEGASGYVYSAAIIPIEVFTGDNTNTQNYNLQLVAGTEIANKDYPTGTNGAVGVEDALTFTGTTAQRTIASGGCVICQREEAGTAPAHIHGSVIKVGWRRI